MSMDKSCKKMFERTILVCGEIESLNNNDCNLVTDEEKYTEIVNLMYRCFSLFCNATMRLCSHMSFKTFTSVSTLAFYTLGFIEKDECIGYKKQEAIDIVRKIKEESKNIDFRDKTYYDSDIESYSKEELIFAMNIVRQVKDYSESCLIAHDDKASHIAQEVVYDYGLQKIS